MRAAWLVQLRTRLLPADAPAQQDAVVETDTLRGRLVALEDIQAVAQWLERQPQLGHDVFARGRPEFFRHAVNTIRRSSQQRVQRAAYAQVLHHGTPPVTIETILSKAVIQV
jgi:hypothetical protein